MSDRKYRHRGYQDDDRDQPRERKRDPHPHSPRIDGAPRGRGIGIPADAVFRCARCGTSVQEPQIDTTSTCRKCQSALHSCTNCTFFNTGSRFECRKPIPQRMESKTKANDCELFQPKTIRDLKSGRTKMEPNTSSPTDARSAFDALFKK